MGCRNGYRLVGDGTGDNLNGLSVRESQWWDEVTSSALMGLDASEEDLLKGGRVAREVETQLRYVAIE